MELLITVQKYEIEWGRYNIVNNSVVKSQKLVIGELWVNKVAHISKASNTNCIKYISKYESLNCKTKCVWFSF